MSRWPFARMEAIAMRICRVLPRMIWLAAATTASVGLAASRPRASISIKVEPCQGFTCHSTIDEPNEDFDPPRAPRIQRDRHVVEPIWIAMTGATWTTPTTLVGTKSIQRYEL